MVLKAKFLEANDLNGCQCFSWVTEQGVLTSDVRYFIKKFAYLISLGKYFLDRTYKSYSTFSFSSMLLKIHM